MEAKEAKIKCFIKKLLMMENYMQVIEQIISHDVIDYNEVLIEMFNMIDQIGNEENLSCLSKLGAEICIKKKNVSFSNDE
jgi:hypothetical protein